jgi:hypothetical protein
MTSRCRLKHRAPRQRGQHSLAIVHHHVWLESGFSIRLPRSRAGFAITEVGVSAGASAGAYTVGLSSLNCTVSPSEFLTGSGGGVHRTFKQLPP